MKALTRADLDPSGCSEANCTHDHSRLWFHSTCHPRAALHACYKKADGVIEFRCFGCEALVAEIQVAEIQVARA